MCPNTFFYLDQPAQSDSSQQPAWMNAIAVAPSDAVLQPDGIQVDHQRDWSLDAVGEDIDSAIGFIDNTLGTVGLNSVSVDVSTLNDGQKAAYSAVLEHINDHSVDKAPLRIVILGYAGTGKSFLIDCIRQLIGVQRVAVAAPTGVAAFNINGSTLHSLLSLSVGTFKPLAVNQLDDLQRKFREVCKHF